MPRLDGKVALVSGGARGLGLAMAQAMAAEGAAVAIGDLRLDEASAAATALGDAALAVFLDVTDEASWAAAVAATVERFGSLQVLVNNAGTAEGAPLADTSLDSYRRVIDVNQVGVFLGMRSAIGPMDAAGGGSIVNISSIDGMTGSPRIISYIASKWAVRGMTKAAAMELAPRNIRVNSVHPGYIPTRLGTPDGADSAQVEDLLRGHAERLAPMGRAGTPEEIARLVVFLASDESSYCTGSEFTADGGLTAGYPAPGSPHPY